MGLSVPSGSYPYSERRPRFVPRDLKRQTARSEASGGLRLRCP